MLSAGTPGSGGRIAEAFAKNPSDNSWLDVLRTIAIALVVLRHGQRAVSLSPDATFLEIISINGWAGVDLFFVLSGFLVTAGLLRTYETHGCLNVWHYAAKRVRRIVPAYFFVLALVVIGYFPYFTVSGENLGMRVAYHTLFLQDILPSDINVVFWSLGVEAKYYALVPFLLLPMLGVKSWRMLLILGLTAALAGPVLRWLIFVNSDVSDYETFWPVLRSPFYACLEPFALGFVVACLERRGALAISAKAGLALLLLACAHRGSADKDSNLTRTAIPI